MPTCTYPHGEVLSTSTFPRCTTPICLLAWLGGILIGRDLLKKSLGKSWSDRVDVVAQTLSNIKVIELDEVECRDRARGGYAGAQPERQNQSQVRRPTV
ncbi:unnamed protein product [Microthlaspi erraticum]|uniref:Uncharacterized protein n=1 Tax=Microthlaspi erraticum TaxID=1685480 RepID=A0A6D2I0I3_9BRAS|nr:unnamed protein product [Microthlaspi erraticum]